MLQRPYIRVPIVVVSIILLCGVGWSQRTQNSAHPAQIHGQVRFPDDRPAPVGLLVSLEMRGGGTAGQTQTDRRGKFEFTMLAPDQYEVYVRAPGYEVEPQVADLMSIPTAYLTFVLKPDTRAKDGVIPPEGPASSISALDANAPEGARKNLESGRGLLTAGKDLKKSIDFFKKAIAQYPEYSEAYFLMGLAYSSQQNWDEAQKSLAKSIELNQRNGAAYLALGSVENERKNYPEAEKQLIKAVELTPGSADAHFELGRAYWGLARWDAADQHVAKANQLRPDRAEQHILMGNIMLRERNAQGALKEFQEALRIDPKGPMAEPTQQMITKLEQALKNTP